MSRRIDMTHLTDEEVDKAFADLAAGVDEEQVAAWVDDLRRTHLLEAVAAERALTFEYGRRAALAVRADLGYRPERVADVLAKMQAVLDQVTDDTRPAGEAFLAGVRAELVPTFAPPF